MRKKVPKGRKRALEMRKNRSTLLVIVIIVVWLSFFGISTGATLENKYLLVYMDDETGRFFISTVDGRPETQGDEKKDLLFFDIPPSSFTVIYLDNDAVIYGDITGQFLQRPIVIKDTIRSIWKYSGLVVTESARFLRRESSEIEDGILITYRVENATERIVRSGLMVVLDTYLGEWDLEHFHVPGGGIKGEKVYSIKEIPNYWISRGTKKNPEVCFKGYVKNELTKPPDKLIFTNYKYIRENLVFKPSWRTDFNYPPFSKNDSVVAFYYKPEKLQPGGSREYALVVGLCGEGKFTLGKRVVEEVRLEKPPPAIKKKEEKEKMKQEEEKKAIEEVVSQGITPEEIASYIEQIEIYRKRLTEINSVLDEINSYIEDKQIPVEEETLKNIKEHLKELQENP